MHNDECKLRKCLSEMKVRVEEKLEIRLKVASVAGILLDVPLMRQAVSKVLLDKLLQLVTLG